MNTIVKKNKTELVVEFLTQKKNEKIEFEKCADARRMFQQEQDCEVSYVLFNRKFRSIFTERPIKKKPKRVAFNIPMATSDTFEGQILQHKIKMDAHKAIMRKAEAKCLKDPCKRNLTFVNSCLKSYNSMVEDLLKVYEDHLPEAKTAENKAQLFWDEKHNVKSEVDSVDISQYADMEPTDEELKNLATVVE